MVATSGGVDSAVALWLCVEAYGAANTLAATSRSESLPAAELVDAQALATALGVEHVALAGTEVDLPAFRRNAPDRCFHCKQHLYGEMRKLAAKRGLAHVVDGANHDDAGDHRPGQAAAERAAVLSPLLALGVAKADVRRLAEARGLAVWDKPQDACLSSRFPYGVEVTREALARVDRAEQSLKALGFRSVRVRVHDPIARLEVPLADLQRLLEPRVREAVVEALSAEGFLYVTVDLAGLRSGSMNAGIRGRIAGDALPT